MGNLCEIPLVSMVIETTEELLARRNVIATVIPGGGMGSLLYLQKLDAIMLVSLALARRTV